MKYVVNTLTKSLSPIPTYIAVVGETDSLYNAYNFSLKEEDPLYD